MSKDKIILKLRELAGIDIRSLALFRMGFGLLILGDVLVRLPDIRALYSDDGVLPRSALIAHALDTWNISLHLANGTWQFGLILFIIEGLFALALTFGYQTRLASVVSWFLCISLQSRNPIVLQGGDVA